MPASTAREQRARRVDRAGVEDAQHPGSGTYVDRAEVPRLRVHLVLAFPPGVGDRREAHPPGLPRRHEAEPVGSDDGLGVVPVELHHLGDAHPVAVAVAHQARGVESVAEPLQRQLGDVGVPGLLLAAERLGTPEGAGEGLRLAVAYGGRAVVEGLADLGADVRRWRHRGLPRAVAAGARAEGGPRQAEGQEDRNGPGTTACARHRGKNDRRTTRSCLPRCRGRSPGGSDRSAPGSRRAWRG